MIWENGLGLENETPCPPCEPVSLRVPSYQALLWLRTQTHIEQNKEVKSWSLAVNLQHICNKKKAALSACPGVHCFTTVIVVCVALIRILNGPDWVDKDGSLHLINSTEVACFVEGTVAWVCVRDISWARAGATTTHKNANLRSSRVISLLLPLDWCFESCHGSPPYTYPPAAPVWDLQKCVSPAVPS